jgi:hypothetical protein
MGTTNKKKASKKEKEIEFAKNKATLVLNSMAGAAMSIHHINSQKTDVLTLLNGLLDQNKNLVQDGQIQGIESMLAMQAKVLNALFNEMIARAMSTDYIDRFQAYMGVALTAQKQTRQTLSTLADIKNPQPATFVKQQNLAVNQQVNNVGQDLENLNNSANELISEVTYETMDHRGTPEAIRADPSVATLEPCQRSSYLERQGCEQNERL